MTFVDASSLKLSPICCPHTPVDQSRECPEKITELVHIPYRSSGTCRREKKGRNVKKKDMNEICMALSVHGRRVDSSALVFESFIAPILIYKSYL